MIKIDREWKDSSNDTLYYFNTTDGKIVGQVHNVSHTKIWVAKIVHNYNEEHFLGQYISCQFAMKAIEYHYEVESRTLIEN